MIDFLRNTFFEPRIAFADNFLQFGPDDQTKFLGMKMDTWSKVILIYIVGFFSSVLTGYYQTVMFDFIHSKLWNPAFKERLGISKWFASLIVIIEPLLY